MKAVLFDLDETLFDRTGSLERFLADQYQRHQALQALTLAAFTARFLDLDNRGLRPKGIVYSTVLGEIGLDDAGFVADLLRDYEQNSRRFAQAFEGVDQVLAIFRGKGLRLGVVTNGRTAIQTGTIEALGLQHKVDTILISEAEGVRKPNGEIFLRAAANLGVEAADCVFVGDSPLADILGSQAVGIRTIWLPNGAEWPDDVPANPGHELSRFSELLDLVI